MDQMDDAIEPLENEEMMDEGALALVELIQEFMDDYFDDIYEVLKYNINFLESNGFSYQTKIDYMKLNRFISSAFNTIQANDIQVIDTLVSKFYKDVIFLNNVYKYFLEKSKDANTIFKHHFLKTHGGLEALYRKVDREASGEALSEEELGNFEDYVREEFKHTFIKEWEGYNEELRRIINTKTYYFDKLLWYEARKSHAIREFFKKSKRQDTEMNNELSTKIFIKQYLQTIDMTHAKDVKWHQYLENVLALMD